MAGDAIAHRGGAAVRFSSLSCFAGKPLRKQIFGSLGCTSFPMVAITCVVVVVAAVVVGDTVREETTAALDSQMERHLIQASAEIAAATSKRFEVIQLSLLNPAAFAFRDALKGVRLEDGSTGYPIPPRPGDIRTQDMIHQPRTCTDRFKCTGVDSSRSSWYFSNESAYWADLSPPDMQTVSATQAVDSWLEPLYAKHISAQSVYLGIGLSAAANGRAAFRSFPAQAQTSRPNLFSCFESSATDPSPCQYPGSTCSPPTSVSASQQITCYNPAQREWYRQAFCTHEICTAQQRSGLPVPQCAQSPKYGGAFPVCHLDTYGMGDAVLTAPYQDAGDRSWMVTLAKAVYGGPPANDFLGVVGIDLLLGEIQSSIISFDILQGAGFAMLVTSRDGTIVAAPTRIHTQDPSSTATVSICSVIPSLCAAGGVWTLSTCAAIKGNGVQEFEHGGKTYVWHGGCVEAARAGLLTHAIIVAVPREDIRAPVANVMDEWSNTNTLNLAVVITLSVATLLTLGTCLFCVSRDITRPIEMMSTAAKQITEAQYDAPGGEQQSADLRSIQDSLQALQSERGTTPDEITDLVDEFAKMVQGLGDADATGHSGQNGDGGEAAAAASSFEDYPENPVVLGASAPSHEAGHRPPAVNPAAALPTPAEAEPPGSMNTKPEIVIQAVAVSQGP